MHINSLITATFGFWKKSCLFLSKSLMNGLYWEKDCIFGRSYFVRALVGCLAVVKRHATLYISYWRRFWKKNGRFTKIVTIGPSFTGIRLSAPQKLFHPIMLLLYDLQSDLDQFCRKKWCLKIPTFFYLIYFKFNLYANVCYKTLVLDFNTRNYSLITWWRFSVPSICVIWVIVVWDALKS